MLDPEYLKDVTSELEDYWYDLETEILKDIAERIKLNKNKLTSTASYQIVIAKELEMSDAKISAYLARALNVTIEQASEIIREASYKSVESDNEIFEEAYKQGFINKFSYDKETFKDIINQGISLSTNDINNLCKTTAQTARKKLLESLNSAYMMSESGAFGYDVIVDKVVSKLASDGLYWIDYPTGTHRRLDTVIRSAVRTAANQTAAKCQEKNMDDLDCNLVETSAHMGSRPSHAEWQGQIFYRNKPYKDYSNFYDATGYGTAGGLCGVNCRHSYFPFFEGISTPSFEKFDSEENNKLYEAQQQQRYNERKIREWDRRKQVKKAAGLDTTKESSKLREWKQRQKDFVENNPRLKRNYGREKVHLSYKNGKIDLSDIKITGALDPNSNRAIKHSEQYYESVRKMKTDFKRIAKNTGFDENEIKRIKNYLFVDEHELLTGKKRFDPDYMIAESWRRLIDGKDIQPHDLTLINHEKMEHELVKQGMSQDEAHKETSKIFDYDKEAKEYHAKINKRKKK